MDTAIKSLVLTREDLHRKTKNLSFHTIDVEHFKDILIEDISNFDLILFFEDNYKEMRILKNRVGKCAHWSPTVNTRDRLKVL